jgi:single-stranded-DNA-specific exonuclease
LCANIEAEAIELVESGIFDLQGDRVLVIVKPDWHHGVIGIVASRLVERYGVPVFIGTNEDSGHIRGSARSIPEFDVFAALEHCHDLLGKYGGHRAAGGFSLDSNNLDAFRQSLSEFAHQCLELEHLKHLIQIDVESNLDAIDLNLYGQIDAIHPCGIENPDPVFWSRNVRVIDQRIVGKGHLQLTIAIPDRREPIKAIAWRCGDYFPVPRQIDIAYKLRENIWQDRRSIQLEIISFRLPESIVKANFNYQERHYDCFISADRQELTIVNQSGYTLQVRKGEKLARLTARDRDPRTVDVTEPQYFNLVKTAKSLLEI